MHSIHEFTVAGIDGEQIDFAQFAGKKILVVNVASRCGYTPQYQQLQELYDHYSDSLVIVGFPANNFGAQEPGTNAEIQQFCTARFGVTFPMAAKVDVNEHPLYQWLTQKSKNGVLDASVNWNFCKFLLDEKGQLRQFFPSAVSPLDESLLELLG